MKEKEKLKNVWYLCSPITTTRGIFFLDLESVYEFKPFPAKIQASNWLPLQLNQLETSIFEGNFFTSDKR